MKTDNHIIKVVELDKQHWHIFSDNSISELLCIVSNYIGNFIIDTRPIPEHVEPTRHNISFEIYTGMDWNTFETSIENACRWLNHKHVYPINISIIISTVITTFLNEIRLDNEIDFYSTNGIYYIGNIPLQIPKYIE